MILEPKKICAEKSFIDSLSLNEKQKEAVLYFSSPLLIIAGAGTGKTKTLISKLAVLVHVGIPASRILAITFTNKAADEMKKRVSKIVPQSSGLWCMTFHSFGARFLRMHYSQAGLKKDFVIYDEDDQRKLLSMVIKDLGYEREKIQAPVYASLISRAKDDLMDTESYLFNAKISGNDSRIKTAQIYFEYQKRLEESNAVDFGDLIMKTVTVLKNNKDLSDYYQNYFRYILVDEYQDINRAQYILIKILSQLHSNICVVGDPDQSIYSWRGADIRNILQFENDFKNAYVITLEKNYRSTANILDAANQLIRNNRNRKEKNLYTENERGEKIELIECDDENDEASKIASRIEKLLKIYKANEIAVFYRTNAQSRSFEEVFLRRKIPHRVVGSLRFYDRKEIKDALAYMRVIVNPYDVVSFIRIINTPPRGIGEKTVEKIIRYARMKGIGFYESVYLCDDISHSARAS
ncbi:MAG: ATP-dependent helicase, partial [Elusimicrobiales bacterium]